MNSGMCYFSLSIPFLIPLPFAIPHRSLVLLSLHHHLSKPHLNSPLFPGTKKTMLPDWADWHIVPFRV